jgi:hypothetical protein
MLFRYRAALALTLAAACSLSASAAQPAGRRHPRHTAAHAAAAPSLEAGALYSARALRRARIILQLKLLELRAERLERVRKALERNLPVERLIQEP